MTFVYHRSYGQGLFLYSLSEDLWMVDFASGKTVVDRRDCSIQLYFVHDHGFR